MRICTNFDETLADYQYSTGDSLIVALSQHLIDIVILIVIIKAIDNNPGNQDDKTNCKKYIHFELIKG
jgi:hypothetical protein